MITGLERGTYIAEEIASDDNHVIDTAPQTVFISGEDQDVVQPLFRQHSQGLRFADQKDSRDKSPLANVEFYVTDATGAVLGDNNGKFWTDPRVASSSKRAQPRHQRRGARGTDAG